MSIYEEISGLKSPVLDVSEHRGENQSSPSEGNYESIHLTAMGIIPDAYSGANVNSVKTPPLPKGGHLHPYSTMYSDHSPTEVVSALATYFGKQGFDYVLNEAEHTLTCFPCFGQTQVPIEVCIFTNMPCDRVTKGEFAFEFRNQSTDSVNFYSVFKNAQNELNSQDLIKSQDVKNTSLVKPILSPAFAATTTAKDAEQSSSSGEDAPLGDDDFLPTLNFAAFDMSLLDDEDFTDNAVENGAQGLKFDATALAVEDSLQDLMDSFQMLVNITNQEDAAIKSQAIRGIVDVMGQQNQQAITAALDSGAFDVLTVCISEAAQHMLEDTLILEAASSQRDMCHYAVSGIANACEVSHDARMATIRSGALPALLLFVSSLAHTYEVHCRELVREGLRAYIHIVDSMDEGIMGQFLEKPLIEERTCGACIKGMISSLESHLKRNDCKEDRFLTERLNAIKRHRSTLNALNVV